MSLWRAERYWLSLGPREARLVSASAAEGGARIHRLDSASLRENAAKALQSAVEAVLLGLARPERSRVAMLLHGSLLRVRIVPWRDDFARAELRDAFARHCFEEAFGPSARTWQIELSGQRYGKNVLGCAIDSALLGGAFGAVASTGATLASVQPAFALAFNQAAPRGLADPFWFVFHEGAHLTLLFCREGAPALVRDLDWPLAQLGVLLEREWALAGSAADPCPVYLYHAAGRMSPAPDGGRWRIETLERNSAPFGARSQGLRAPLVARA